MLKFKDKKIKEIKIWAWIAAVAPITTLAGLFFVSMIGLDEFYQKALTIGATAMFAFAVTWWWWAIYTMANIATILSNVIDRFDSVKQDLKELKKDLK